ncbi:exodeoxyribonuclease VII large subunit [Mesotoga sp. BH458_6_3_2_1]|uniref:exodeoxyribonuclease VII large subunit n=1 Tax=Mesotoga sp. BH458_6_3_2_1 TaxID=1437446 RepID=UPI000EF1F844|nr:exodeoxyribonuclease VII large subunit [Mesotoga sp. BH458_6_3_2_1]RLL85066.1 exonuclease VII large subunit [Mesotoga sp. BH458_6_3_2_1]
MEEATLEFKDLENMLEHIKSVLTSVGLNNLRVKFPADVTNINVRGSYVYISVSQDYEERGTKRRIDLSMISGKPAFARMGRQLALKNSSDLMGKKWLFEGTLSFYKPRASFSIWIDTIAPVGESDITARRREIYLALKARNALRIEEHDLGELPPIKRIAVISSSTAAGLGDFFSNLSIESPYKPVVHLFESYMQGNRTVPGVLSALKKIASCPVKYDVVVLTRGGGSASDLMYFDSLDLGTAISDFNKKYCPVLSAIGHERDFTIPDFVAWKRFDTPTAVARGISEQVVEYVSSLGEFADLLDEEINWLFQKAWSETDPERLRIMSDRIEDNMDRTEHFFEDGIRVLSGTILHRIVKAVNELGSFNPSRYLLSIERAMNEISAVTDGLMNRAETTIQRSLHHSESQLDYEGLRNQLDRHLMNANGQVELLDKGILRLFDDTINESGNDLDNLFNELTLHGGYAASLLFGGVVLKKADRIINSVRLVSPGDEVDCIFKDGEAKATIDEVKSEV